MIVFLLAFLVAGCGGRKNEFRTGILNYNGQTIAWYTNKHNVGYAICFPKARSVSDSLVTTKKNVAVVQQVVIDERTFTINGINELKDGLTRVYLNGIKYKVHKRPYIVVALDGTISVAETVPQEISAAIVEASHQTEYPSPEDPLFWLILGFTAQAVFTGRFLVQWIASEKAKQSVIPVLFWYFSLTGSTLLFIYAIYRQDPVFIIGQGSGLAIYVRNLALIKKNKKQ